MQPTIDTKSKHHILIESKKKPFFSVVVRRMSDHREFVITPSRFQWDKFKDLLHFFVMIGVIPITAIVFYANVFVGPAKLTAIPEGYVPKHWEYYRVCNDYLLFA